MLTGKTALITGSTGGIGLTIAKRLAEEGCNIALHGLGDETTIKRCVEAVQSIRPVQVAYCPSDVTKPQEIREMVDKVVHDFGRLDILVNNAGVQFTSPLEDFPEERWDALLAINLSACFHTTKRVVPLMKAQNFGRIINLISAHGLVASVEKSAYIASKHGLSGLTKAVALETALYDVTCNGICPGFVLTPLAQKQIDDKIAQGMTREEAEKVLLAKQPKGQFIKPEDVAAYAAFLCGPHASSITGALLSIDGGWTAQ